MIQQSLFSPETAAMVAAISKPDPPHRGIDTQIAAAKKVKPCQSQMHARIINLIEMHGGLTRNQIVEFSGFKLQTVCARVWDLVKLNTLYDSDERRDGARVVKRCVR